MMLTRCSGLSSGWKKKGWGRRELRETAAWVTLLHGIYASYRGAADLTSTLLEPLASALGESRTCSSTCVQPHTSQVSLNKKSESVSHSVVFHSL